MSIRSAKSLSRPVSLRAVPRTARGLTDRGAVVMAGAAFGGAWLVLPGNWVPVVGPVAIVAVVGAFVVRRPWLLVVGVALGATTLGARAEAGLNGVPDRYRGEVELIGTPDLVFGEVRAEVRAGPHHLDLLVPPSAQDLVEAAGRGDRFMVSGQVTPVDPARARRRGSHVAGRLRTTRITAVDSTPRMWRVVGSVRDGVKALGRPLPASQQALFDGFVLGDAAGQTEIQQADFRASGLTHLFVASGEHVAFLLLLAAPLLARVGPRTRWTLTIGLCVLYAMVTGLQPSVLRAATMAVVATTASGLGRPVRSWRSLAFAVTVLVLIDPFLVHSVAFGLSVGASTGIVALARPLVGVLGGPLWLRRPFAVTIAAQIGAAPLLIGFPGGMPLAAIPANVLAVPPAGLIMVSGIPALGVVATGLPGTGVLLWIPRLLLGWVEGVARVTAALPMGYLGGGAVVVAVLGLGVALAVGRDRYPLVRRSGYLLSIVALASPMLLGGSDSAGSGAGPGPVVVRRGSTTVVVLTGTVRTGSLLTGLSVARVRGIDAVVVPHGDDADEVMLEAIAHRHRIRRVVTARRLEGAATPQTVVHPGERIRVGAAVLQVVATDPVLSVYVEPGRSVPESPG